MAIALDTLTHESSEEFFLKVKKICDERMIQQIVIGLPLLPSGEEGEQARVVRDYASALSPLSLPIHFVDERYSSVGTIERQSKHEAVHVADDNAASAVRILGVFLGY